ncbi:hypothetical protein M1349_01925, partial [Patescibacteria group bacterium]|nr:hypothetical protein [Patescibacteria group bacterium]
MVQKKEVFLEKILNLPDERVLVAKRQHWLTLATPLFTIISISLLFVFSSFYIFILTLFTPTVFVSSIAAIFLLASSLVAKSIVDWYFHLYVITNRKILEVCYSPMFSHSLCDVLLDQVRCTEIDVKINGIVNELFNNGDIIVSFDRPTHQEVFTIKSIENPNEIGHILGHAFASVVKEDSDTLWYRLKNKKNFGMIKEIFPNQRIGGELR